MPVTVTRAPAPPPPYPTRPATRNRVRVQDCARSFALAWRPWRQNILSAGARLAQLFIGGLGGYIRILFWTWYVFAKNAKAFGVGRKPWRPWLFGRGGSSRGQNTWAHMHISLYIPFFLLKNNSNKMTIRQASPTNPLIRHAYSPAKHGFFPGRLSPSFSPKTPTFSA